MARTDPIVVVGDCLLDVDLTGRVSRLCPDEPAPVVDDIDEVARPGGAGLAAVLAGGRRPVVLITAIGRDDAGQRLRGLLHEHVTLVDLGAQHTVVKTRVRAGTRTLLRIDQATAESGPERDLPAEALEYLDRAAAVLVSDYGLGLTSAESLRAALGGCPTVWDPHPRGAQPVRGVTTVTPNIREAQHFAGMAGDDLVASARQGAALRESWGARSVAVTRGSQGVVLCDSSPSPLVVPADRIDATDMCGAGDAFAAGVAVGLADGEDLPGALCAGVRRASGFLAAGGVGALRRPATTIGPDRRAEEVVARTRAAGGTVVMAGGCFDLLHAGHVTYLEAARALGDCLVVALNSDDSVRRLKGDARPLVPAADRARVLQALSCVDVVEVFEADSPADLLKRLQPDIFAKGGDYRDTAIPEAAVVHEYGGQVVVLPELAGRSSSRLMRAAHQVNSRTEEEQWQTA